MSNDQDGSKSPAPPLAARLLAVAEWHQGHGSPSPGWCVDSGAHGAASLLTAARQEVAWLAVHDRSASARTTPSRSVESTRSRARPADLRQPGSLAPALTPSSRQAPCRVAPWTQSCRRDHLHRMRTPAWLETMVGSRRPPSAGSTVVAAAGEGQARC